MKKIKWGIIGSGKIAKRFAGDLLLLEDAELIGVTSRNQENSQKFSEEFKTYSFKSIDELLSSDVDVIYVATPHSNHREHSLMAINAGKAVLCEKPFAMNASEAREMFELASARKIFIMEAMWTRFFPAIQECLDLVKSGAIGRLQAIKSSFGYKSAFDPKSRIYDPALGGGSLLDVGVYTIAFALMFTDENPSSIESTMRLCPTGVDESTEWKMTFPSGVTAYGSSSVVEILKNEALLVGTNGVIRIPRFWHPEGYYLNDEFKAFPQAGMGFQLEAQEVMTCLSSHLTESSKWRHRDTLAVMKIVERIHRDSRL